ncbi:MAG: PaaI family thioesterase [Thermogutta sp.]|nr:PaaI family thioesterase [Thermogutta sp.]
MNHLDANLALSLLRRRSHPDCFVCAPANGHGFGLEFHAVHDGAVEAAFPCRPVFAGYPGILHGGVICTLLDGAMTNCLFAHGLAAVTVDIHVRFRHPVRVGLPAVVRAWLESEGSPVHRPAAELLQDGQVVATATARFVEKDAVFRFGKKAI